MPFHLPLAFLLLQAALVLYGAPVTAPAAYLAMVLGPMLAAGAAAWRGRTESGAARLGWFACALSLACWSAGAFGNLWQEWVLGAVNEMYRSSMLGFTLAGVPLTFLLATEWRSGARPLVRAIDAVLALALGYLFFLFLWNAITDRAMPEDAGVAWLVWLVDVQNLYIALGACVRWYVAEHAGERDLFRALSIYSMVFLGIVFLNDHYFAGDPAWGPEYGSIITLAFATIAYQALKGALDRPVRRADRHHVLLVRSANPVLLALALLVVSLFLVRVNYAYGCAGVLVAVLGYGLRNAVVQAAHIRRGDALNRQRSELQAIAWTDALTGVANRHFLDQALRRAWRSERRAGGSLGILMVDIDHFKSLNDRYGHPAGDSCLREVARVLQQNLVRPDDVLARYGGEEFIALLRNIDTPGAQAVAERLRTAIKDLAIENLGSPLGIVTISVGVASANLVDESAPERLVSTADRALYEAKCAGRDQVRSLAMTPA